MIPWLGKKAENLEIGGCRQRDSAEHEEYDGVPILEWDI
jgi:hypothetical protein